MQRRKSGGTREDSSNKARKAIHIVETIAGERHSEDGQKQFLIKWKEHTEHTCEPEDNLHCSDLIREWTNLTKPQQKTRYKLNRANRQGIVAAMSEARTDEEETFCALIPSENFTQMDLNEVYDALEVACRAAGIIMSEVAAVLLSPPCETYSVANCNNIDRGNNCRQHDDPRKPPRKNERGASRSARRKAAKAELHDTMIRKLICSLVQRREDFGFEIILENPRRSLQHRPFTKAAAWVAATTITLVNYCAFRGGRHVKPTQLWTTLEVWKPVGNTGTGLCEEQCGKGMKHDN